MDDQAVTRHGFAARAAGLATALGLAILVGAAPVHAQQGEQGQQGQQMQRFQEMQQLQQELRQVQKQLRGIQQQAFQDSTIQRKRIELGQTVRSAMSQLDSEAIAKEDSLNAIQRRLQTAQQNQDTAQLRGLMSKGRQYSQELNQLRDSVMQRDSIAESAEQLRQELIDKMVEINPEAEELIARRDSLMRQLRQMTQQMRGQQGQPPGNPGGSGQQR